MTKHKMNATYDPETRSWQGGCSCNKWVVLFLKSKEEVKRKFDKHVEEVK